MIVEGSANKPNGLAELVVPLLPKLNPAVDPNVLELVPPLVLDFELEPKTNRLLGLALSVSPSSEVFVPFDVGLEINENAAFSVVVGPTFVVLGAI